MDRGYCSDRQLLIVLCEAVADEYADAGSDCTDQESGHQSDVHADPPAYPTPCDRPDYHKQSVHRHSYAEVRIRACKAFCCVRISGYSIKLIGLR